MNTPAPDREAQWDEFLQRWPLASLATLTLPEYSTAGATDCFVYWLEARTESLGSIWGGSAFKFGVYSRRDTREKTAGNDRRYSKEYAWYAKYGDSAEAAFARVRQIIVDVAQAARQGDLERIDAADLGQAVKWKLAFLYQSRRQPCVLPIYSLRDLRAALEQETTLKTPELQRQLLSQRDKQSLFDHADACLQRSRRWQQRESLSEQAMAYFAEQPERFYPIDITRKMAGYRLANGRPLALLRDGKRLLVFLQPGPWQELPITASWRLETYPAERSRPDKLSSYISELGMGYPAIAAVLPDLAALQALCLAYETDGNDTPPEQMPAANPFLNQILFGPPGSGKTHAAIDAALEILAPESLQLERAQRKARFDALVANGQARFVTFHQSFSYEDFVEGLRAVTTADRQLEYRIEPGIFKRLCDAARGAPEPYVLVIDEINRGNVSRIFGELITLIEPSKRAGTAEALSVALPYSKDSFSVPANVHLVGTMNTADRSLAGLDIALRRRFVFREMPPRPELLDTVDVDGVNIGQLLRVLNLRIERLLDRDHCLGHAYFMPLAQERTLARLELIFRNQVLPLLQEYFFEDWQRIHWVLNDQRKALENRFIYQRNQDLLALFGEDVSLSEHDLPWSLNEAAFRRIEAYRGIVDHRQAA